MASNKVDIHDDANNGEFYFMYITVLIYDKVGHYVHDMVRNSNS